MEKLVLPSDSNRDLYPDNKIGHYRVRFSQPVIAGTEIALSAITYPTDTTSSGFYVTLPGLVRNDCSPAGSSCVRNVVVSKDNKENMFTESFSKLLFMPMRAQRNRDRHQRLVYRQNGRIQRRETGLLLPDGINRGRF